MEKNRSEKSLQRQLTKRLGKDPKVKPIVLTCPNCGTQRNYYPIEGDRGITICRYCRQNFNIKGDIVHIRIA